MALIADIFEMLVIDSDGEVLVQDTLQESNINVTTETNDVTGGRGDALLAILHGRREIEITGNTPTFKLENLAKHLGTDIVTGEGTAYAYPEYYTVEEDKTIGLKHEPVNQEDLIIKKENGMEVDDVVITGKDASLGDNVEVGDRVQVMTYLYKTDAKTQTLDIDATKFPQDVKIVLQTLEISEDEQPTHYIQFEYERVKPSSDFSFNTSSARDAAIQEMSFRVLKPKTSDKIGVIKRIPLNG